ncbi:hypothetical protein KAK06_13295 [Ideonella sp. 4Y11]|uniref:O-antigen ligase domain-containing protein n=1 Tax=Ideonella aquatica TaxID=2824119 RepID=A0A941BJX1_9BURK|nr:hypothetical protein [Ideonella aquatica]MBQ0959922.1 hypothetical protein [Ideonella aquatica]
MSTTKLNLVERALIAFLVVLGIGGLLSYEQLTATYYRHNLLPATAAIEVGCFILLLTQRASRANQFLFIISVASFSYILVGAIRFAWDDRNGDWSDFFYIYKSFFYLAVLSLNRGGGISSHGLRRVLDCVIALMALKYFAARLLFEIPRPGLFAENNFELMLPLFLALKLHLVDGVDIGTIRKLCIAFIVMASGSLSGAASFSILLFIWARRSSLAFRYSAIFFASLTALIAVGSRTERYSSADDIDRVKFLQVFLAEMRGESVGTWLLGNPTITALSDVSCIQLAFYSRLFSEFGEGNCFSVVLHSFVLRAVFDHGLIGLMVLLLGMYVVSYYKLRSRLAAISIIFILILNGLSVSSMNSTFFFFSMLLIFSSSGEVSSVLSANGVRRLGSR